MSPEQINIAIAESLGWAECRPYITDYDRVWGLSPGPDTDFTPIPDYCNDLNEVHTLEDIISKSGKDHQYILTLAEVVRPTTCDPDDSVHKSNTWTWNVINASARQRCEAYLRTIGKWNS